MRNSPDPADLSEATDFASGDSEQIVKRAWRENHHVALPAARRAKPPHRPRRHRKTTARPRDALERKFRIAVFADRFSAGRDLWNSEPLPGAFHTITLCGECGELWMRGFDGKLPWHEDETKWVSDGWYHRYPKCPASKGRHENRRWKLAHDGATLSAETLLPL